MKVTYISACQDVSGYAEAARNNIASLLEAGISVEVLPVTFETFKSDLGILGNKIKDLIVRESKADIQIIHTTPNVFSKFINPAKKNIGFTTWETTALPIGWTEEINKLDEVWCPSQQNVEVFQNSGVTIPIHKIPHAFNRELFEKETVPINLQNLDKDAFNFYSIFQWTSRKNPEAILKAYLTEFKSTERVCLILKTYLINPNNPAEKEELKKRIIEVKNKLYLKDYPKTLLISDLLSRNQIHQLHQLGDCYLSFAMNEGFGIPITEAMMAANPAISTNYGGPTEFIKAAASDQLQTGYPVSYQMTPCYGMPWDSYSGTQSWADINILEARQIMRYIYEHQKEAKQIGLNGQAYVDTNYSWRVIGNLMKERLEAKKEV